MVMVNQEATVKAVLNTLSMVSPTDINEAWVAEEVKKYDREWYVLALCSLLNEAFIESDEASQAIRILFFLDRRAVVEHLLPLLQSENTSIRAGTCYICGLYAVVEAKHLLEHAIIHDSDPDMRFWAANALGEVGDLASLEILQAATSDPAVTEDGHSIGSAARDSILQIQRVKTWPRS